MFKVSLGNLMRACLQIKRVKGSVIVNLLKKPMAGMVLLFCYMGKVSSCLLNHLYPEIIQKIFFCSEHQLRKKLLKYKIKCLLSAQP